jgi:hypothetical protein
MIVPAGDGHVRADRGAIDEMLVWCQVVRVQSLGERLGALGFMTAAVVVWTGVSRWGAVGSQVSLTCTLDPVHGVSHVWR